MNEMENNKQELLEYVGTDILLKYSSCKDGHGIAHILDVVDNVKEICKMRGATEELTMGAIVAAYYHDLGSGINRRYHHLISAEMFEDDMKARRLLDNNQYTIDLIAGAIRRHRTNGATINIIDQILWDADKGSGLSVESMINRCISYRMSNMVSADYEAMKDDVYDHLKTKYFTEGERLKFKLSESQELFDGILKKTALYFEDGNKATFDEMYKVIYNNMIN